MLVRLEVNQLMRGVQSKSVIAGFLNSFKLTMQPTNPWCVHIIQHKIIKKYLYGFGWYTYVYQPGASDISFRGATLCEAALLSYDADGVRLP